jgi:hypothetical protein
MFMRLSTAKKAQKLRLKLTSGSLITQPLPLFFSFCFFFFMIQEKLYQLHKPRRQEVIKIQ